MTLVLEKPMDEQEGQTRTTETGPCGATWAFGEPEWGVEAPGALLDGSRARSVAEGGRTQCPQGEQQSFLIGLEAGRCGTPGRTHGSRE